MAVPTIADKTSTALLGGGSASWSHTVTSGTSRMLLVALTFEHSTNSGTQTYTAVTYGGTALTRLHRATVLEAGNWVNIEIWYLVEPAVGTATITTTLSGTISKSSGISCTLRGVAASPAELVQSFTTTVDAATFTNSITSSTVDALLIDVFANNNENVPSVTQPGQVQEVVRVAPEGSGGGCVTGMSSRATAGAFGWSVTPNFGRAVHVLMAFSPAAVASNTLSMAAIQNGRVFRRVNGTADIALSGTFAGTAPVSIYARVLRGTDVVLDWKNLSGTVIAAGAWSGTLTGVPEGDGYRLIVASRSSTGSDLAQFSGSGGWGVGDIFAVLGSSTAERWFTDATSESASSLVRKFDSSGYNTVTGSGAIAFGNALQQLRAGIPVLLLSYGVSGTKLSQWTSSTDSNYQALRTAIATVGGKLTGAIVHVGSNDAREEAISSQSVQESRYRALISNIRSDCNQPELPIYIMGCQRAPLEPATSAKYWTWARAAEMALASDTAVYLASEVVDLPLGSDSIHLSAASMAVSARRVARAIAAGSGRGPRPESKTYNQATGEITVTFTLNGETSLAGRTSQTGITGFQVTDSDGASLKTILKGPLISSRTTVWMKVAPGLTNVKVGYLLGTDPDVSNCLFDDAP